MSWEDPIEPTYLRGWAGELVTDLVRHLLACEIPLRLSEQTARGGSAKRHISDPIAFFAAYQSFWSTYDARTEEVVDHSGRTDSQLYNAYYIYATTGEFSESDFWDWIVCRWLNDALKPLFEALEQGIIGIAGQREPVLTPNQAAEPVPYSQLEDRLWRLYEEKSRMELLSEDGSVLATFRRCRLTAPDASPGSEPETSRYRPNISDINLDRQTDDEVRQILNREFDLTVGSQKVAAEFSKRYRKQYPLTQKRLRELTDEVRGSALPRGRPRGSRK